MSTKQASRTVRPEPAGEAEASPDAATTRRARARLFEVPSNPIPEGTRVGHVQTSDEFRLRYARWETLRRPSKGTVILLHGRTEFIEKHFETVQDLRGRGFGVLTFDWRGQGGSTRLLERSDRGHIENFNQHLEDLETVFARVALPDCRPPYYILAHSTGALVALLAAPELTNRVQRMVLISPLLRLAGLPVRHSTLQRVFGLATLLGLGRLPSVRGWVPIGARSFIGNKLTSDTHRFNRLRDIAIAHPHLVTGAPTIAWVFAALRAMETVHEPGFASAISVPTLFVAGGMDTVVSPRAIESYGRAMRSGAFLTVSGARHELLEERDSYREQFLAAFDAFVPGTQV